MMHVVWMAEVTLGSFCAYSRHSSREDAQAWLARKIEIAHSKGIRIRSPKITYMVVSDYRDVRSDWADD